MIAIALALVARADIAPPGPPPHGSVPEDLPPPAPATASSAPLLGGVALLAGLAVLGVGLAVRRGRRDDR